MNTLIVIRELRSLSSAEYVKYHDLGRGPPSMFLVYVIKNPKAQWYIGQTNDLKRRLREHNTNASYTTKRLGGPWKPIYIEICLNEIDAKKRERFLKTTHGRKYLQRRLKYYLQSSSIASN